MKSTFFWLIYWYQNLLLNNIDVQASIDVVNTLAISNITHVAINGIGEYYLWLNVQWLHAWFLNLNIVLYIGLTTVVIVLKAQENQ